KTKLIALEYTKGNPNPNSFDPDGSTDPASYNNKFYKLTFNSTTGQFSAYSFLFNEPIITGMELSTDSNKLYYIRMPKPQVGLTVSKGEVVVKDLANLSSPARIMNLSGTSTASTDFTYIQKDRWGNMLISSVVATGNRNKYLHKVENQNNYSTSTVLKDYIYLHNNTINALPQTILDLQSCQALTLGSEPNTGTYVYEGYSSITVNGDYSLTLASQNISMKASNYILLQPNTNIIGGASFLAKIQACSVINSRLMDSAEDESKSDIQTNLRKGITVFPNPSSDVINISVAADTSIRRIDVFTTDGRLVYTNMEKNKMHEVEVRHLQKGMYILTTYTDSGDILSAKFLKY
ncbi:MAG TPA: T9SS type A sorting domain-containing protein, partial [Flavobacterium sp.]